MDFREFRERYVPKKAWIPAGLEAADGLIKLLSGHLAEAALEFWLACLWLVAIIAWRTWKEADFSRPLVLGTPKWWTRFRWWGIHRRPSNGNPWSGWYILKIAWMPPIAITLLGAIFFDSNPKIGAVKGASIGIVYFFIAVNAHRYFQEMNTDYPLTQEEAWIAAGYTNKFQATSLSEWWRIHSLAFERIIAFDAEGNIYPGGMAWNPVRAKQGLPQVEGAIGFANDYLMENGPYYHRVRHDHAVTFGGTYEEPKYMGIPPQPSIPK